MQPSEYAGAIMAGLGVIFQFARSGGVSTRALVTALLVIAVVLALAVNPDLPKLADQFSIATFQTFLLGFLLSAVGTIASGLGGMFGTAAAAHEAVKLGANPAHPAVPVTPPREE